MRDVEKTMGNRRVLPLGDKHNGAFMTTSPVDGGDLRIIVSSGMGWDHVSVSRKNRCPNWPEMDFVKHLCFEPNEVVMQLHVPASEHINYHPYCLHLWKPHHVAIPRPPVWMVGPAGSDG